MIAALLFAYAALSLLCLAMTRHYRHIWRRPPTRAAALALRAGGILLICLSLWINQRMAGNSIGLVVWLGELTLAMLLLVLVMTYRSQLARLMALAACGAGLVLLAGLRF